MSKILIIEDDIAIAELEKDYLEVHDYTVVIEKDGSAGAARALDENFDLIILDLMLPGMDGFEICKFVADGHVVVVIARIPHVAERKHARSRDFHHCLLIFMFRNSSTRPEAPRL